MFSTHMTAAQAYSNVSVASGAMSASPHGLVLMLFEGALISVSSARMYMQLGRTVDRAQSIARAIAIIQDGLMASLDRNAGGEIAERLFSLYEYMVERLSDANARDRVEPIEEVGRLLAELNDAWKSIGGQAAKPGLDGTRY